MNPISVLVYGISSILVVFGILIFIKPDNPLVSLLRMGEGSGPRIIDLYGKKSAIKIVRFFGVAFIFLGTFASLMYYFFSVG